MAAKSDYYQTLGVERKATAEDIRKAYRRLARKYHPDLNPGDKAAEERFKSVQEAYSVLSDAKKRQMYDQVGFYSESGFPPGGAKAKSPHSGVRFEGFDFPDIFARGGRPPEGPGFGGAGAGAAGAGGFGSIFEQFFGGSNAAEEEPEKGADLEYAVNIDFWQAIRGTTLKLNIARQEACGVCGGTGGASGAAVACPQCSGTGKVSQQVSAMRFNLDCPRCKGKGKLSNACAVCQGEGRIAKSEQIEVRIPQGAQNGSRLRVAGKGNAGRLSSTAGDLYITTRVEPHPFFRRDGDNIEISVPITVSEAGLGAKIEVPTIDGRAVLKVPMGTQNGQKFRLREKGVFSARKGLRGDQIVEVSVQPPKVHDERTRELLRELARLDPEDPRATLWSKV